MKFLYALSALIYFTQGIGSLPSQALFYYLRETLGMAVSTIMMLGSITSIPWMVKPLYGLLSDRFPIFGYRRKAYIILSGILSVIACLLLGLSPFVSVGLLITLLALDSLGGAIKDVAVDGLMVEEGKRTGLTGKIQSIQWGTLALAQVLTGVAGGYIAEHFSYKMAYLIVGLFPLAIIALAMRYRETKATPLIAHKRSILTDAKNWFKNRQFVLTTLFLFCLWFSPATGTPILDRMRGELALSKVWIGWLSTIGSMAGICGAVLYFKFAQQLNIRRWLVAAVLISAVSTLAYLWLTPTTVLWYAIVFGLSTQFAHLVLMDLMARSCPEGSEATTFALVCSVVNFGTFCSNIAGAKLFGLFGYNGLIIISSLFTFLCLFYIPYIRLGEKR